MRRLIPVLAMAGFASCGPSSDLHTPEGAHAIVQRLLDSRDYRRLYDMVTSDAKRHFCDYIDSTRQAALEIRRFYPEGLKFYALQSLTIPLPRSALRLQDIESDIPVDSLFSIFCNGVLIDQGLELTPIRRLGLSPTSIDQKSENEAIIETLGGESVVYCREKDGAWRTHALFGRQFEDMASVGTANLAVIRQNIRTFSNSDP